MKNGIIILLFASGLLAGCKSEETLAAKKAKLDELKQQQETISFQIIELEAAIKDLDPAALDTRKSGRQVTTFTVQKKPFQKYIDIQGSAESDMNVLISAEVSGEAVSIPVSEGEKVKKGQLLLKIDDALILRDIENLKVESELATTVFKRQENLWKQNIGSEMQYLEAKSKKENLETRLKKAQTQLDKTRIKSPVNGTVENIQINAGETAAPGMPLMNVVNLDEITVKADVPESYIGVIKKGEEVTINFPALGIERKAKISSVGNIINPGNRTFRVEIILPNKDHQLKANLLAIVKIADYQNPEAITLPTKLIQQNDGERYIYLLARNSEDPVAKKAVIKTGVTYGTETEVVSGLATGDTVINEGSHDVTDGSLLDIQPVSE